MKDHLNLTTALINKQISLKANTRIFLDGEKLEITVTLFLQIQYHRGNITDDTLRKQTT